VLRTASIRARQVRGEDMNHEDHAMVDYIIFRHTFIEVHRWLDATYPETEKSGVSPFRHWITRHNVEALRIRYGDQTREFYAGCVHIICDWLSRLNVWALPKDEAEVIEKLKENNAF